MPGIDGLEATRRIVADSDLDNTKVIVLTSFDHDKYVVDALRYRASGFLLKDTAPAELIKAIRLVADGDLPLSPSVTRTLVTEFVTRSPHSLKPHASMHTLTNREREVVVLSSLRD